MTFIQHTVTPRMRAVRTISDNNFLTHRFWRVQDASLPKERNVVSDNFVRRDDQIVRWQFGL